MLVFVYNIYIYISQDVLFVTEFSCYLLQSPPLRKEEELLERVSEFQVSHPARLWAMSDIHADKKENMQWLSELDLEAFFGEMF